MLNQYGYSTGQNCGRVSKKGAGMKCESCPAGWENRSYEGECSDFGCIIYGSGICRDDCRLSRAEIEKRVKQWEDYTSGRIERPQWVANKFVREMDAAWWFGHKLGVFLPGFPPLRMHDGCHEGIYSASSLKESCGSAYREGYEDAKTCKPMKENW